MLLSQLLKTQTREEHRSAEKAGIIRQLVTGQASLQSYVLFLYNLQEIYRHLEDLLETLPEQSELTLLARKELYRSSAIERDLRSLLPLVNHEGLAVLPETKSYQRSMVQAAGGSGLLLIAHSYVRYLGDLSGGQILASVIKRSFSSEWGDEVSIASYQFPEIVDIDEYKVRYKQDIDGLGQRYGSIENIVNEAKHAFELNRKLSMAVSDYSD